VAVGLPTTEETLLYGLELLKKEDEPTLIVFPDLQSLVPAAADVAAAQAVVPVASYHESVATKAKEAAGFVTDAVAGADVKAAVAAGTAAAFTVANPGDLDIVRAQAAQTVLDAVKAAAAVAGATVASVKLAAQNVLTAYDKDLTTASDIVGKVTVSTTLASRAGDLVAIGEAYSVYNKALDQAGSLKDRFVIMDVLGDDATFRNKVSSLHQKYGAAYYPKLKTVLSYDFKDADVSVTGALGIKNYLI
jgi:hypothetical protein